MPKADDLRIDQESNLDKSFEDFDNIQDDRECSKSEPSKKDSIFADCKKAPSPL